MLLLSLFLAPLVFAGVRTADSADLHFEGPSASGFVGDSSATGDINGDGNSDILLGAPALGSLGNNGLVYLLLGPDNGTLTPAEATATISGTSSGDQAGFAVHGSGDFDGDGTDDVLVGAPYNDGGATNGGRVYLFYGPVAGSVSASTADVIFTGTASSGRFGSALASLDVDSDGTDDVIASAPYITDYAAIFAYSGGYAPELRVAAAGNVDGDLYPDFLFSDPEDDYDGDSNDEGTAFLFYGTGTTYSGTYTLNSDADVFFEGGSDLDEFGGSIASGDVNNDGKSDIFVTAPQDNIGVGNDRGSGYLFYGPFDPIAGIIDLDDADTVIDGDDAGDWSGYTVAGLGDVNCDGVDDFATGGILADASATSTGAVYIYFGPTPGSGDLAWLNTFLGASDADVVFYGDAASDWAGNNIAGVGDLDYDGCADFAIAAAGNDGAASGAGAVYVFYGTTSFAASLDSSDADAVFEGAAAGDAFGTGLRGGGDFDADGIDDLVIGAPNNDGAASDAGAAYVFFGASGAGAWSGTVSATSADCVYRGVAANEWAGWSFATGFDFDNDGSDDLAIGSPGVDDALGSNTGLVALFYSTACSGTASLSTADAIVRGKYSTEQFGFALAAGDVDDDGYDDLVVGAPYREDWGSVYWIPGRSGFTGVVRAPAAGVRLCSDYDEYHFGWSVDAGNVDAEPGAEVIAGAPWFYVGETHRGQGYAWYGDTIAGWENDGLCHAPSTAEVKLVGEDAYDFAGWSIATVGDLNQDGEEDIGIGAYGSERGSTNQGASYVVLSSH